MFRFLTTSTLPSFSRISRGLLNDSLFRSPRPGDGELFDVVPGTREGDPFSFCTILTLRIEDVMLSRCGRIEDVMLSRGLY